MTSATGNHESRSSQAIITAVIELLEERDANEIRITDVVKRAGVTRPTFYQSFRDLSAAFAAAGMHRLEHVIADAEITTVPVKERLPFLGEFLQQITRTISYFRVFYQRILNCSAGLSVFGRITDIFADRLQNESPLADALRSSTLPMSATSRAVAAGALWMVKDWLDETDPCNPDDMAERLRIFITSSITGGLGAKA
jgi:AcrR family transcriptional regulator